jgi:hypothetical protein
METYWQAFAWLSRHGREFSLMTGAPLPLSLSSIESYVGRFGPHDPDEFQTFVEIVRVLDDESRIEKPTE